MNSFDLFGNPLDTSPTVDEETTYGIPPYVAQVKGSDETIEEDRSPTRTFWTMSIIVFGLVFLLGMQTFNLQVIHGNDYRARAESNSIRLLTLPADRGLITDINGVTLAQNTRQPALAIDPQTLPAKKLERQEVYTVLKEKAGIDEATIAKIESVRTKSPEPFVIKGNLSKDELLLYKEYFADTRGVLVQEEPIRQYTALPSIGHLLGYVGQVSEADIQNGAAPDQHVGKSGLEKHYNTELTGTPGKQRAEVNAVGEIVQYLPGGDEMTSKTGHTLRLSIDSNLQKIVAAALQHGLERRQKEFGNLPEWGASAIVLDPSTGAVKAMVSLPDYDNNLFAEGISSADYKSLLENPSKPLINRATQDQLPSGSVIKPLIAAAGLQEKVITPQTKVLTPEAITIGSFRFPDWKYHAGLSDVVRAIAESNDVFFYSLGGGAKGIIEHGLGIDRLNAYLRHFGLGAPTGVDIPGEQDGLVPDDAWKRQHVGEKWYIGDTYHSSIGQGYTLVTPLQMAAATAAIVNGGTLFAPRIAWSTIDPDTKQETLLPHPVVRKDFISAEHLQVVRQGMRQTVLTGSARPLSTLKVTSAGKTGTAQFGDPAKGLTHAWYTGFAPYENPELVFAVSVEAGGESFYSSVPVVEEILRNYFNDPLQPGQKLNSEPALNANSEFRGEH